MEAGLQTLLRENRMYPAPSLLKEQGPETGTPTGNIPVTTLGIDKI